jgi:hypothetical protein
VTAPNSTPPSWLLPLTCAVVPALAVHAAWLLSLQAGAVPDCIPHVEGCTSISRAARHGTANVVFKALMLPCAVVQALHWRAAARWMDARFVATCGVVAALALAAYAAALGTDGAFYQWMRRFGITFYFGATFLAILAYVRRLQETNASRAIVRGMLGVCALMLALGVASVVASATLADPAVKDRVENVLEWQLGALLTAWFLMQSLLWRSARRPRASGDAG